jgi:phosphoglycerol transferase MdoB-like AlkP superfamily enzyme
MPISSTQLLYHENLANRLDPRGSSSHFLASLSNAFVDLRGFVPALSGQKAAHGEALAAWILAALLLTFLFLKKRRMEGRPVTYRQAAWPLVFVHSLSALFIAYVFFNIRLNNPAGLGPDHVRVFSRMTITTVRSWGDFGRREGL